MRNPDEKMMALALAEARKGWGRTSPNPMVGAVVADGGRVVSKGFHARAGTPHAEPVALDRAGDRARGAVLYVTLEPCNHQGRTPPCTAAILASGVRRVVIGARDPNPHVRGGGAGFLAERGLDVVTGVLGRECEELNVFFNKFITTGRPYVIVKSAATLDGKLATREGHSRWVTGDKARRFVHRLRHGVDAILVGRGTVLADDPSLNTRLPGRAGGIDPLRIVLDTRLSLPVTARVFDPESGGPTLVACGPGPDGARVRALEKRGVEVLPLPLCRGRVELASLLDEMGRRRKTSLLIEGGAEINAAALVEEKIADRILFFFAPKIIGGRTAPTLVGGLGAAVMDEALRVEILKVRRLGDDWLFEARPLSD